MPPIPVPRAAAMPVPIRKGAMTVRLFLWEIFPWGQTICSTSSLRNVRPGVRKTKIKVQGGSRGRHEYAQVPKRMKIPGWCNYLYCSREPKWNRRKERSLLRPVQLGLEQLIQVGFEETESRTLSDTGPISCVVFCWEGKVQLSCDSQVEGKGIAMYGEGDRDLHIQHWDVCRVYWKNQKS